MFYKFLATAFFVAASGFLTEVKADNLTVDGTSRNMLVYAPTNIEKNRPLIIQMHGMNQDAAYQKNAAKWESIADTARFVVVFPNGINKGWDLGGTKDLNFLKAIINEMSSKYGIDKNRVYVSGFSMGGMMSYYAASKMADQIAAIAPVSGYPLGGGTPSSSRPMPILHTHGTTDDVVNYNGGVSNLKNWVNYEKCSTNSTKYSQYPVGHTSSAASLEIWTGCESNSEIRLMSIAGKGHWYSMDLASVNTSDEIWNFVKRFSLDGASADIPMEPPFVEPTNRSEIYNGNFDSNANAWTLQNHGDAKSVGSVKTGVYDLEISAIGSEPYTVQLIQHNLRLEKEEWYEISFDAKSNEDRTLEVNVEQHEEPWASYLANKANFEIGTNFKTYTFQFQMTAATDTNSRLSFNAGAKVGNLLLDNISLKKIDAPKIPGDTPGDVQSIKFSEFTFAPQKLRVFSITGQFIGIIKASSKADLHTQIKLLTQKSGVYMVLPHKNSAFKILIE